MAQGSVPSSGKVRGCLRGPEARQLRLGQRFSQLEDARHLSAVVGQVVVVEAAKTEREDALLATDSYGTGFCAKFR